MVLLSLSSVWWIQFLFLDFLANLVVDRQRQMVRKVKNQLHFRTRTQLGRYSYSYSKPLGLARTSTISLSANAIVQLALVATTEKCLFNSIFGWSDRLFMGSEVGCLWFFCCGCMLESPIVYMCILFCRQASDL